MVALDLLNMDDARIAECRSRFCDHPLRLVQVENFLQPEIADKISRFLHSEVTFGPIYGVHKKSQHIVDHKEWMEAPEEKKFFHYEMMDSFGRPNLGNGPMTFLKLRQLLSSEEFCRIAQQITGESLPSVTQARVHRFRSGHYLRAHDDRMGARKIAYILYLSPQWETQFGGQLSLIGQDGTKEQLEPAYNSLVLFDVTRHKEHYIEALTPKSEGQSRDTMGGWFLSETKN